MMKLNLAVGALALGSMAIVEAVVAAVDLLIALIGE